MEQLQALRTTRAGGSPDERWLASTRETLLMQMKNTVGARPAAGFRGLTEAIRLFSPEHWGRMIAIPLAVVFLMFGVASGSSLVVSIARNTLPGDALYPAKLAAERVSLLAANRYDRTERKLEIAGRRLDEMIRLAVSTDAKKEEHIAKVSVEFSGTMSSIRKDLADLQKHSDTSEAVRVALHVDAKADEYQQLFKNGTYASRPTFRLALLSLDQVAVDALEVLVEKQSQNQDVYLTTQLTSNVGKRIETFANHVAATEGNLSSGDDPTSAGRLLTAKAKEAVEEAKTLLSQGDFKAAVRKVGESADLVAEAESAGQASAESAATSTSETDRKDSASGSAVTEPASQP